MPPCPPKTLEQRQNDTRWEHVVGKALKDWVTRRMIKYGQTRAQARADILVLINEKDYTEVVSG